MVNFTSTTSRDFHENSVTDSTLLYKDGCVPLVPTGPKCNALQCKLLKELLTAGQKWKLEWHSNNKIYLDPVFYLGRHQIVITHWYLPAKCTWFIPINIHAWFPISLYRNVKGAMQYVRIRRFLQFILKTNSWQEIIKEPLCRTSIARVVFTQQELWTRTGRDVSMLTQVDTATTQYIDFITSKLLFAHIMLVVFVCFFDKNSYKLHLYRELGKCFWILPFILIRTTTIGVYINSVVFCVLITNQQTRSKHNLLGGGIKIWWSVKRFQKHRTQQINKLNKLINTEKHSLLWNFQIKIFI